MENHLSNLLDLMLLWLQIQNLGNAILRKNVMVAADPFGKTEPLE